MSTVNGAFDVADGAGSVEGVCVAVEQAVGTEDSPDRTFGKTI